MKKEILKEAYNYLRSLGKVHTKKDLAIAMSYNIASVSRAFSGDARYLTEDFLRSLNNSFGNIFSQKWLLTGEGDMLNNNIDKADDIADSIPIDYLKELLNTKNELIYTLKARIYDLEKINANLEEELYRLKDIPFKKPA